MTPLGTGPARSIAIGPARTWELIMPEGFPCSASPSSRSPGFGPCQSGKAMAYFQPDDGTTAAVIQSFGRRGAAVEHTLLPAQRSVDLACRDDAPWPRTAPSRTVAIPGNRP